MVKLSTVGLTVVVLLMTLGMPASTFGFGAFPLSMAFMLTLSVLATRRMRKSNGSSLGFLSLCWIAWILVVVLRLKSDYPHFGSLALRDALIVVGFAPLWFGKYVAMVRCRDSLLRFQEAAALAACFGVALSIGRSNLPGNISHFISWHNAGVGAFSLVVYGLWGQSRVRLRVVCLVVGVGGLLIAQSRTLILLITVLLIAVPSIRALSSRAHDVFRQRGVIGPLFLLTGVMTTVVLGLRIFGITGGRVGEVSLSTMLKLGQSVFDDSSDLAGTRILRASWIESDFAAMSADPWSWAAGLGLGRDLALGFAGPDGTLVRKPHNDYLEALFRTGVVGFGFMLLILGMVFIVVIWALGRHPEYSFFAGWLIAAAATAAAQPYLSYPHGVVPFAVLLGLLWTLRSREGEMDLERFRLDGRIAGGGMSVGWRGGE